MKYFSLPALNKTIIRIREGNVTQEHVTGSAALGLIRNYFPVDKFGVTGEQIQPSTRKKPDYAIERYIPSEDSYVPHCFVELKSLVNSNIDNIVDQLFSTTLTTVSEFGDLSLHGSYSVFMIAIKGTKIAFYAYHGFGSLLDDFGIIHYNGFIPLNYKIPEDQFTSFHSYFPLAEQLYRRYETQLTFETDSTILRQLNVLSTNRLEHPHVFDLLNTNHREHIHNMFEYVRDRDPNKIFIK